MSPLWDVATRERHKSYEWRSISGRLDASGEDVAVAYVAVAHVAVAHVAGDCLSGERVNLGHDVCRRVYYGFPDHTYELSYPAPGSSTVAHRIGQLLDTAGIKHRFNTERGYDHGVFVPLLMYPDADIPVVQVSLRSDLDPRFHLELGAALAPLRDEGVLIVGSGMSYHNMSTFMRAGVKLDSQAFDEWLGSACAAEPASRRAMLGQWAEAGQAGTRVRAQMSLQSSQADSGMTFTRMSAAKSTQPRQKPKTDSSVAAIRMAPTAMSAAPAAPKPKCNTSAVTDRPAPMPWANRLGAPGTSLASRLSIGVSTRVTV